MSEQNDIWSKPVPPNPTDEERIGNAILHLGRVVGGIQLLKAESLSPEGRDLLRTVESAAKRSATWLGVTLWSDEYPPFKEV